MTQLSFAALFTDNSPACGAMNSECAAEQFKRRAPQADDGRERLDVRRPRPLILVREDALEQ